VLVVVCEAVLVVFDAVDVVDAVGLGATGTAGVKVDVVLATVTTGAGVLVVADVVVVVTAGL
jgi:hypothetical protein